MSKLIELDAAIAETWKDTGYSDPLNVMTAIRDRLKALPPVDAVPVVHGRWETVEDWDGDEHYKCSVCGAEFILIDGDPDDNDYLYCPHCGARMDGKDGDHHDGS